MKSFCIFLIILLMSSCASIETSLTTGRTAFEPLTLNSRELDYKNQWAYKIDSEGIPWLCYYSSDYDIYIKRADGYEIALLDKGKGAAKGIMLEFNGDNIYVVWREKLQGKRLKFRRSMDRGNSFEPAIVLDEDSDPLTRIRMVSTEDALYLLWLGERGRDTEGKRKPEYHLYFKYSEDRGKTFSETYKVLQGIYPAWIVDEEGVYVFSWAGLKDGLYIAMRKFDDTKKEFSETVKIRDAPHISPYLEAFKSGQRMFIMWLSQYGESHKDFLLEGAYSDDKGKSWKGFSFESIRGFDLSKVDISHDRKGNIYIAFSGLKRFEERGAKENVYIISSSDNGSTWTNPLPVRHHPLNNTRARFPSIASNDKGEVVVAWEDWRDIRPNLYINYSRDYGVTWQSRDIPLQLPGKDCSGLNPHISVLTERNGEFYLIAERYNDDSFRGRDVVFYTLSLDALNVAGSLQKPAKVADENYLRNRVMDNWEAFLNDDYEKTYYFIDPFFRARNRIEDYLTNKGKIKYHSYEIGEIKIEGNIAKVKVDIVSSIPNIMVKGKKISRPETKGSFIETWVFVYDEWYKEYYNEMAEFTFTRY